MIAANPAIGDERYLTCSFLQPAVVGALWKKLQVERYSLCNVTRGAPPRSWHHPRATGAP